MCFRTQSQAVRAFHAAALEAGGRDDGPPGLARSIIATTMEPSCSIPMVIA